MHQIAEKTGSCELSWGAVFAPLHEQLSAAAKFIASSDAQTSGEEIARCLSLGVEWYSDMLACMCVAGSDHPSPEPVRVIEEMGDFFVIAFPEKAFSAAEQKELFDATTRDWPLSIDKFEVQDYIGRALWRWYDEQGSLPGGLEKIMQIKFAGVGVFYIVPAERKAKVLKQIGLVH